MNFKGILLSLSFAVGISCGVKSFPEPPPSDIPQSVKDIHIKQQGNTLVVYWTYNPIFIDGRKLEKFTFIVEVNGKRKAFNIKKTDKYYWIEYETKAGKEYCFRIFTYTKKSHSISNYKCIYTKHFEKFYTPVDIYQEKQGIRLSFPEKVNDVYIYKGNNSHSINPIEPIANIINSHYFLDKQVKPNSKYCYFITKKQGNIESNRVYTNCIIYKDIYPPDTPKVSYIKTRSGVTLIFSYIESNDFAGIMIEKNGRPVIDLPIKTYFFKDKNYKKGDTYKIYSVDNAGNKSDPVYLKIE